jgi:hypothetical protein
MTTLLTKAVGNGVGVRVRLGVRVRVAVRVAVRVEVEVAVQVLTMPKHMTAGSAVLCGLGAPIKVKSALLLLVSWQEVLPPAPRS